LSRVSKIFFFAVCSTVVWLTVLWIIAPILVIEWRFIDPFPYGPASSCYVSCSKSTNPNASGEKSFFQRNHVVYEIVISEVVNGDQVAVDILAIFLCVIPTSSHITGRKNTVQSIA
jgi:hypothetical protein